MWEMCKSVGVGCGRCVKVWGVGRELCKSVGLLVLGLLGERVWRRGM